MPASLMEWCELLSYIVTIFGFPLAILIFAYEQRKERQNEEEELFQRLSDEYTAFLKLVLDNADLQLLRKKPGTELSLTDEQKERQFALFGILISLFERAYMLVYEDDMDKQTRRLWLSWEDYMRDWCKRPEFTVSLPELLEGEDEDFRRHIESVARAAQAAPAGGLARN
jgi:hypothetical protein